MADTIIHRGPDDDGYFSISDRDWALNMGMRRLAIIDREGGHQPVHAGKVSLVYNGEIYNYRHLRRQLGESLFRTESDTEVVARAWDAHDENCLSMLEGMFSCAVWNRSQKALYLARDRIGKKPLYLYWDETRNLLVAGSEIKAILAHPHVRKDINPVAINYYLSLQYIPEPLTALQGIQCVPAGGIVRYRPAEAKLDMGQWYECKPNDHANQVDETWPPKVRDTVIEAIACRLESEVPLGVYLSGGVDSAIIAAVAKQHLRELHTFSMGFAEDAFNELPQARQTAQYLGTVHHEAVVHAPQLPEMVERIVSQYDQPFGDPSAIPTMLLAQESRKYITVALTGDGGDEAFGGYERYLVADPARGIMGYIPYLTVIPPKTVSFLLDDTFRKSIMTAKHVSAWMVQQAMSYPGEDLHNQMAWLDVKTYLPNDIVVKMERASMAASVEARSPFLDHRVLELGMAIPSQQKIEGGTGKLVLKEAFRDMLPLQVMLRPKRGFGVPMDAWWRSDVGRKMLMDMTTDLEWPWGILDGGKVASVLESHLKHSANCGHVIFVIYMLHCWMKRHFA